MRFLLVLFTICFTLSACGPRLTPEQSAKRAANVARNDAAVENSTNSDVNGKTFRVAVVEERKIAFVDLLGAPVPYNAVEIETAAQSATNCVAKFDPGILAFLPGGDVRTADLSQLREKVSGRFWGWTVKLGC